MKKMIAVLYMYYVKNILRVKGFYYIFMPLLFLFVFTFIIFKINFKDEKCISNTFIIEDGKANELDLDINLNHGKNLGVISMEGKYRRGLIRRDIYFSYSKNGDDYIITSREVEVIHAIDSVDNNDLRRILPDFFIESGNKIRYTIQKQFDFGYMFSVNDRPIFLCLKKT